jgi:hypothetical protein
MSMELRSWRVSASLDALSNTKATPVGNPDLELDVFPRCAG